jgi:UDP-glucose 4-epimerase
MVFRALQNNERPKVFGDDYPTKDGSCIRDYIHVSDLADAHVIAAQKLATENYCGIINIGRGEGFSVKEVMNTISEVIGKDINYEISERRPGDPPYAVADVTKSSKDLNWKPQKDLKSMINSAWQAWQSMPPSTK